jgi:Peptidase family M28
MILAAALIVILAMGLIVALGLREVDVPAMNPVTPAFDAAPAMEYAKTLATGYPDRVTGSPQAARAAEYLRAEFQRLGYRVTGDVFSVMLGGHVVEGDNVIAELKGEIPESVGVIAHYDAPRTSHEAAEDNAAGVGVLLELARALRTEPHRRGLVFVATDAAEWGMLGARDLRGFFRARDTLAVISIDGLTQGQSLGVTMDCEGQRHGYTPLWLREMVIRAGDLQGVSVEGPSPSTAWMERALEVSAHDQGPLLSAGIPAVNLSTISQDRAEARRRYHSVDDVFANFEPRTFKMVGDTVEQAVAALVSLEPPPPPQVAYLRLNRGRWLDRTTLEWLQTLGLLPFVLACSLAVLNLDHDDLPRAGWSYVRPAFYMAPSLAAYVALHLLTSAGVLPRYQLYPATPRDPFLDIVPLLIVLPLLGAVAFSYLVLLMLRSLTRNRPGTFYAAKRILCLWTFLFVIAAFYLDPFAMWFFVGPFAYAAILLQPPSNAPARVTNGVLLLAAAAPFVGLLAYFGHRIFLGWRILWYLLLQIAYGVWTVPAVMVAIAAVTIWVQMFYRSVLAPNARPGRSVTARAA